MGNTLSKITDFLRELRKDGPWTLWASQPDSAIQETRTFYPGDDVALEAFIDKYKPTCNMYYVLNPVVAAVTKNPTKEQIAQVEYFHVDVDPDKRSSEPIESQKKKILAALRAKSPTFIIDSGGGMQALWRLQTPLKVVLDPPNIPEIEAFNRQLEREFSADNCHNINRLLRLPHTTNFPTAVKRKRGRVEAPTDLVLCDTERCSPLNHFIRAEVVSANISPNESVCEDITNLTIVDVDDIPQISQEVRHCILTGNTPDGRFASRSEAVFAVVCHMIKQGCDDRTIASVLLDKSYRISDHIYANRNPQAYARRQIIQAKNKVQVNPELSEMNERFAVVQEGGKTMVMSYEWDHELEHYYVKRQTLEAFQQFWMHRTVDVQTSPTTSRKMPLAKWWLAHPQSRRFEHVIFAPNKDIPNAYNLWRGLLYEPRQGDWSLFHSHVRHVICRNDDANYEYLMNWMARAVQKPHLQGHVAVVMRGGMGSGKGCFARHFGSLFGRHYLQVVQPRQVTGNFNAHLRECVVLFADEAFFAGDKTSESVMKALITEEHINIERKHVDVTTKNNCLKIIAASNHAWVVPAGKDERRYFVLDVDSKFNQNTDYFDAIEKQMLSGGREAMLYDLMKRDISRFNVWKAPRTQALYEQQLESLGPEYKWWYEKLRDGQIRPTHLEWSDEIEETEVLEDYMEAARKMGHRFNKYRLDKFFAEVLPNKAPPVRRKRPGMVLEGLENKPCKKTFYVLPSLKDCRQSFCRAIGIREEPVWPDSVEPVQEEIKEEPF